MQGRRHPVACSCPRQAGEASQEVPAVSGPRGARARPLCKGQRAGFGGAGRLPRPGSPSRLSEGPAELHLPCVSHVPFGVPALPVTRTDRGPLIDNGTPLQMRTRGVVTLLTQEMAELSVHCASAELLRGPLKGVPFT